MSGEKSNSWQAGLLKLLFQNTTYSTVGDATGLVGSTGTGNLYVSLHTADPGPVDTSGHQTTSEATYTGYLRVAVVRSSGGWTVSGTSPTQVTNAAQISFPACSGGSNTITHVGIGTDSIAGGTSKLLYSGPLTSSLSVSNGITPSFAASALTVTED